MNDIHTRVSPKSFLKLSCDVASFYGFHSVAELGGGTERAQRLGVSSFNSIVSLCTNRAPSAEPTLVFYATHTPTHVPVGMEPDEVAEFGLQVIGSEESVGEILLVKTLATIIGEWGGTVARVRVNALGDKDSRLRFARELSLYVRKHLSTLEPALRARVIENPLALYACTTDVCMDLLSESPRAMNFLSEKSREHFRTILEHLEGLGLPYELDDLLVGDEREARVTFALDIKDEDATMVAGYGGRYDDYVQRITGRKDGAAVGASIFFRKKGLPQGGLIARAPRRVAKIYFVQLGLRAQLQGLAVVDALRRAQVPVLQSFDTSKLTPQLDAARKQGRIPMVGSGSSRKKARPTMSLRGKIPHTRESELSGRLSPITKYSPAPSV